MRYFKFSILATRGGGANQQIAEFNILLQGALVSYGSASASAPGGSSPSGEDPSHAIDGSLTAKYFDFNKVALIINLGQPTPANQYTWATANDHSERDPWTWVMYGSVDGLTWRVMSSVSNYDATQNRDTFVDTTWTMT